MLRVLVLCYLGYVRLNLLFTPRALHKPEQRPLDVEAILSRYTNPETLVPLLKLLNDGHGSYHPMVGAVIACEIRNLYTALGTSLSF